MAAHCLKLMALLLLPCVAFGQVILTTAPLNPTPPPDPPSPSIVHPRRPPLFSIDPGPPPTPPDLPLPDLNTLPMRERAASPVRRALQEFMPRCLDFIFHTCWASAVRAEPAAASETDRELARNLEVGDFYFRDKNYRAAESRYREALEFKPGDPGATFKLAAALEKLGRTAEALDLYRAYLTLAPDGASSKEAKTAIQRLEQPRH